MNKWKARQTNFLLVGVYPISLGCDFFSRRHRDEDDRDKDRRHRKHGEEGDHDRKSRDENGERKHRSVSTNYVVLCIFRE